MEISEKYQSMSPIEKNVELFGIFQQLPHWSLDNFSVDELTEDKVINTLNWKNIEGNSRN